MLHSYWNQQSTDLQCKNLKQLKSVELSQEWLALWFMVFLCKDVMKKEAQMGQSIQEWTK